MKINLETISLIRYKDELKDFKEEFNNNSSSSFIHYISDRLEASKHYDCFTYQSAYVVLDEEIPCGYLYISSMHNDEVSLEISVLKDYRGKGIGRRILDEVSNYLFQEHNIRMIKVDIDLSNKKSLSIAEACSYELDEEEYEKHNFIGKMTFFKESDCYISKRRK